MSSLATKEVLQKELEQFTERASFLSEWIESLEKDGSYESKDKAYKLGQEMRFKEHIAEQRKKQIEQIEKQEELKEQAIKEFPEALEEAKKAIDEMAEDVDKIRKTQVIGKKKQEEKNAVYAGFKGQLDHATEVYEAINEAFNKDKNNPEVLNDFRTIKSLTEMLNKSKVK